MPKFGDILSNTEMLDETYNPVKLYDTIRLRVISYYNNNIKPRLDEHDTDIIAIKARLDKLENP